MAQDRIQLTVQSRETKGESVKNLRKEGLLPANIYGPEVDGSVLIQMETIAFSRLLKKAGETDLIDLKIQDSDEVRPVLIYEMQVDPLRGTPIHVDFFQVNMSEEVEVDVPIELVGTAPADKEKRGILLNIMTELPIRVLPADIPHGFEIDLSVLAEVGDQITVSDLTIPEGVTVLVESPEEQVIAKIDPLREIEEPDEDEEEGLEGEDVEDEESDDGDAEEAEDEE